jgi:type IV secretory pathway VirB2 component (pilin)
VAVGAELLLGKVGYVAKGIAIGLVGGLFCYAALTHDPKKSGGLDAALHELLGGTLGTVAVVVVGVGIAAFGLYLLARSRHLDDDSFSV